MINHFFIETYVDGSWRMICGTSEGGCSVHQKVLRCIAMSFRKSRASIIDSLDESQLIASFK